MNKQKWTIENIPDLTGKVVIVTGGNSGLGKASVKAFVEKGGSVVLACRSVENGESAKAEILTDKPEKQIVVMQLDLMDLNSIKSFASAFKKNFDRLDILLNNAGIMTTPYGLTKDGFESQMGTNHLGHFALTGLLIDLIQKTPNSRVVTVSSLAHKQGKMDFNNLLFDNGKDYTPLKAYGRSKLSNLLFTYELQRLFDLNGINSLAIAAHPGVSQTNLTRHIEGKWWFWLLRPIFAISSQSSAMGALPQIRAAVDSNTKGGEFYGPDGYREMKGNPVLVESNEDSHSEADAKRLWEMSENLTGIKYFQK